MEVGVEGGGGALRADRCAIQPQHGQQVALRIADNGPPGLVEIVVEDDGPGLPPEAWDVVFNVGEQWSEQASGSGLGLAIVRDLVELYGGKITLGQSELGGLKARLALPEFAARPT